jgi:hypothetical protein
MSPVKSGDEIRCYGRVNSKSVPLVSPVMLLLCTNTSDESMYSSCYSCVQTPVMNQCIRHVAFIYHTVDIQFQNLMVEKDKTDTTIYLQMNTNFPGRSQAFE